MANAINIQQSSVRSLLLSPQVNGKDLGTGTGFVVEHEGAPYLITNYHVLAARRPDTGANLDPKGAWPSHVSIMHNVT
ncbi:MAG: hypothetical protein ACKVVP_19975, partial [Chloroflexota bacterium]